jgi:7-carboxy-7-deazaguanine synthase
MNKLAVSESFYSIQGEGQTMGIPSVFLRLGGCNLLCESAGWRCDTIEVWSKSKSTDFIDVLSNEWVVRLRHGAHLVITGGEPMLHEKHIISYLDWFESRYNFLPIVEIETNGTIKPSIELSNKVKFWNVSPKLSSAGEQNTKQMRINEEALNKFSSFGEKTIFKFVICTDDDIAELLYDYSKYITKEQIVLMPAGSSQEELSKTRLLVAEKCRVLNVRYSERLHVVIWNLKTGV